MWDVFAKREAKGMTTVVDFNAAKAQASARPPKTRFEALDILRGLFMIGMLLANNAGDWKHIWAPFDHAEWHGFTMTDMVFPGFMVCVGLSMSLSLGRRMSEGGKGRMAGAGGAGRAPMASACMSVR